jgi:hypothetical protein
LINCNSTEDIENNISSIVDNLQNNGWWSYWNDESMNIYLSGYFYKNRVDNYLLWKYELYLCDDSHPAPHKVLFEDLIRNESIEHIAPQTPTNGNSVANGYGIYEDKENSQEGIVSGNWINSLGNLLLISQALNSKIGNKPFSEKLKEYGEANLLNQQKEIKTFVSDKNNPVWDKKAIEKRQGLIITAAKKIWDLNSI